VTKILLIRHGHVEGIEPERFRGRTDLPLTKRGAAEARAVAKRIASTWRPTKVYTSPMKRCIDTGGAIAQACHVETEILDDLNESTMALGNGAATRRFSARSRSCLQSGLPVRTSCDSLTESHFKSWSRAVQTRCASSLETIPTTRSFSWRMIA
jgi:broad specificity phosphatase PhoE